MSPASTGSFLLAAREQVCDKQSNPCPLRLYCPFGDADKEGAAVCSNSFADTVLQAIRKRRQEGYAMYVSPWLHLTKRSS
jgi:hypothetical protein